MMEQYLAIIFNAARDGNLRRLKVFLDRDLYECDAVKSLVDTKMSGTPAIVISGRNGHVDVVRYLAEKGANLKAVGVVNFDGETIEGAPALWAASAAGHLGVVEALLDLGADVNQTTNSNSSPLRGACYDGHLDVVKLLVSRGADVEIANRYGHTPLMIASYREKVRIVEYLLSVGANPNGVSQKGNTALHDAAEAGNASIVQLLLNGGSTVQKDDHGLTPMLSAALFGHREVIDVFNEMATIDERVDALKLYGATVVDKSRDLTTAVAVWKEALQLRDMAACAGAHHNPCDSINCPVPEVYRQSAEVSSLRDVEAVVSDPDALRMQAMIMRERILGPGHPETHYYLRYRGAVYADIGQFDRCFELWMHALNLQQSALEPMDEMTQATILAFAEIFTFLLNDRAIRQANNININNNHLVAADDSVQLSVDTVEAVFERSVAELERERAQRLNPTVEDDEDKQQPGAKRSSFVRGHVHTDDCRSQLGMVCLIFVETVGRLCLSENKLNFDELALKQLEKPMMCTLRRLARMDVRSCDRSTLLHCACNEKTGDDQMGVGGPPGYPPGGLHRRVLSRFPSLYVVRRLLQSGADPLATDDKGRTPLHVLLENRQQRPSIVKCMLSYGAQICARSHDDRTVLQLIQESDSLRSDIRPARFITLKGVAANAVRRAKLERSGILPQSLIRFVECH